MFELNMCSYQDKMAADTCILNIEIYKKESPPALTQEAYRPQRSKCSLCCSVSCLGVGAGTAIQFQQVGYPIQSKQGGATIQSQQGVPPSSPDGEG